MNHSQSYTQHPHQHSPKSHWEQWDTNTITPTKLPLSTRIELYLSGRAARAESERLFGKPKRKLKLSALFIDVFSRPSQTKRSVHKTQSSARPADVTVSSPSSSPSITPYTSRMSSPHMKAKSRQAPACSFELHDAKIGLHVCPQPNLKRVRSMLSYEDRIRFDQQLLRAPRYE
jgi:hypothetical protein